MDKCTVNVPNIEKELNAISANQKQIKACLFTLLIFAKDDRQTTYFQELVSTILDKFPCRIIFIQTSEEKQSCFNVSVSTLRVGQSGSKNANLSSTVIACDQVLITVSQDQLFRVPFVVIPHIVPDLPVYFFWGQNPFEEQHIFPHLKMYATRVIFDSECAENLEQFSTEMQNNLSTLKIDIMDINWALLSNWRDLLAQLFDSPEKATQLQKCKSIAINYNHNTTEAFQHPEIRAVYLQGWLASRLKWKFYKNEKKGDQSIITYQSNDDRVTIILAPQSIQELPPGAIISIGISTEPGDEYALVRKQNLPQVLVHASTSDRCALPFTLPLPNNHRGFAFVKEIFFTPLGSHYLGMLKMISQLNYKKL